MNPVKALVRFKFLEIIVRLAEDKYLKSKVMDDLVQALTRFLEDIDLFLQVQIHNEQLWRKEMLWNEKCDTVLRFFTPLIKLTFNLYKGRV